jgi:hypothetical protein
MLPSGMLLNKVICILLISTPIPLVAQTGSFWYLMLLQRFGTTI